MIIQTFIEYFEEGPLIPLLLSTISLVAIIIQCFTKHRFLKTKLIFNFLLIFSCGMILVFYIQLLTTYISEYLKWIFLFLDIVSIILLFTTIDYSLTNESFQDKLIYTLNETKNYLVLDKKDRIREISGSLLETLNIEKSDVIGKNCFEAIDKAYMITGFNGESCNVKDILKYYTHYYNKAEKDKHPVIELNLEKNNGLEFVLTFIETTIFRNDKYKGRILIGDKKNLEALAGVEKQNEELEGELDLIRNRFITLLNKTSDGIFFNDLSNKSIWFNDILVKKLNLTGNSMDAGDFYKNIHPDDFVLYQSTISSVQNEYQITYRFNNGGAYTYLKERGNKIISNTSIELCGVITVIDDQSFETSRTMLDIISSESEMQRKFTELISIDKIFQIVYIRLDSIPEINETYGRAVGNNLMSQYIHYFKQNFVIDDLIYRVTGLEFVAFITSNNKMEALKNRFKDENRFLHPALEYPGGKIDANVYMGIAYSNDTPNRKELITLAKNAMTIAMSPKYTANFAYYREIR